MSQLPNKGSDIPFERISKDINGEPEYGFRKIDGVEEVVHIPSGRSNSQYWQREMVQNPEGCDHRFIIENVNKREILCQNPTCSLGFTFHVNDLIEDSNGLSIVYKDKKYLLK